MTSGFLKPVGSLIYGFACTKLIFKILENGSIFWKYYFYKSQPCWKSTFLFCWTGQVPTNHEGQCLEMVGQTKLKSHVAGVRTICVNDRYKTENQHGGISTKSLRSWNIFDSHGIQINPAKSKKCLKRLGYVLNICWYFWMNLGILLHIGISMFGILVHLGKSFCGIFEILHNYGTSWKINILESPLNIPSPPSACQRNLSHHFRPLLTTSEGSLMTAIG